MMTAAEPFVNVMRTALAAFASGLGGADSVTLLPFSQAIGLPDAFARRLARNTQLVELREARIGFVADPAAGAGAFEALTEGLCEKAWALFQTFEAAGGLEKALDQGLVQSAVGDAAATLRREVARAKTLLTGVSAHAYLDAAPVSVLPDAPHSAQVPCGFPSRSSGCALSRNRRHSPSFSPPSAPCPLTRAASASPAKLLRRGASRRSSGPAATKSAASSRSFAPAAQRWRVYAAPTRVTSCMWKLSRRH